MQHQQRELVVVAVELKVYQQLLVVQVEAEQELLVVKVLTELLTLEVEVEVEVLVVLFLYHKVALVAKELLLYDTNFSN
jgi:hypothetical protein